MSRYSYNYKNLMKCPDNFNCFNEKTSKLINTNNPQMSTKVRQSQFLNYNNSLKFAKLKYGNFGNLLNANNINNQIIQDLINTLEQNSDNNNYIYVNNTIQNYSQAVCTQPNNTGNQSDNYNQFYQNYYKLQNILNKQNIEPNKFIFKNKY